MLGEKNWKFGQIPEARPENESEGPENFLNLQKNSTYENLKKQKPFLRVFGHFIPNLGIHFWNFGQFSLKIWPNLMGPKNV